MNTGTNSVDNLRAEFRANRARGGSEPAFAVLTRQLELQPVETWLACAQDIAQLADEPLAATWLQSAIARWPQAIQLHYWLAFVSWSRGDVSAAERQLRELLGRQPDHADALRLLAMLLRNDGRFGAAAQLALDSWRRQHGTVDNTLQCADFIRHCQRQALAAELCDEALHGGIRDPAIHAQAGMLALELGRFDAARSHLMAALDGGVDLNVWFVPAALAYAQRYSSARHPDFELFDRQLRNHALSQKAQASVKFALAKACDDIGDITRAAGLWREANLQARAIKPWSSDTYRSRIAVLLKTSCGNFQLPPSDIIPIFIVGLPRSGTTLAAVLLGRHSQVRDRGELPHLGFIAERLSTGEHENDAGALHEAARLYYAHLRQDDAPARWYIDKTPVNFVRLDVVASLFPQAQVIHCRRNRRDTALSLYSQFFAHTDGDFAYDFLDIAAFAAGHDQLMEHWRRTLPLSIHTLDYEELAQRPAQTIAALRQRIGIADDNATVTRLPQDTVIASSSLWQATQPVYTSSIGRSRIYASHLPELARLFPDMTC
ncbi:MAG: sulfotransferase [Rudaea sp.]|nr:sulfotransferase [Rudaea sp.]